MADGEGMGTLSSQCFGDTIKRMMGNRPNFNKHNLVGFEGAEGIGYLQISVVEGRNFGTSGDGQTFRPSVELQIGDHKVRTDTLKDTLSPSWLADFNLAVPSEDSRLCVSVINSDLLLDSESLVGKGAISVHDLLYSGTRVQWIQMKDPNDTSVGEICLVLRYSSYQAPPSSTAASTSSETRDDNQNGLKALLCQCPPQASSSHVRCISDDAQGDLARSMVQEVLLEDQTGTIVPGDTLLEEVLPMDPSTLSPVLQKESLVDEDSHKSCKDVDCSEPEINCGGSQPCNGQHRMVAFAGALVAVLAAITWGSKFCKRRAEDQEKVVPSTKSP